MKFSSKLVKGTLVKRYKRFLADVRLEDGTVITATCPNTGSMMGLTVPGICVWLSVSDNPKRKYAHTWEMLDLEFDGRAARVGINTGNPNKIVTEAIRGGAVAELRGYENLRNEVKYGINSRIDVLLEDAERPPCYVEVKNVHLLRKPGIAEFPDSVTERGTKHLREMANMVAEGARSVMLYLIQRDDAESLGFAADIDPTYVESLEWAISNGVEAIAYSCKLDENGIELDRAVPLLLD